MTAQNKIEEILKQYPQIWKTESSFMSFLRGGVRSGLWNKHPVKLEFIKNNRIRIENPKLENRGRFPTVWGGVCALTGELCVIGDMEVDHKVGGHSLRSIKDLQQFVEGLALITAEDLQLVSKVAHKIKSMSEKNGTDFNTAMIEKKAIQICKDNLDKAFLEEHNLVPATTKAKRRQQIVEFLTKENLK